LAATFRGFNAGRAVPDAFDVGNGFLIIVGVEVRLAEQFVGFPFVLGVGVRLYEILEGSGGLHAVAGVVAYLGVLKSGFFGNGLAKLALSRLVK
jgi:hypothetical protein